MKNVKKPHTKRVSEQGPRPLFVPWPVTLVYLTTPIYSKLVESNSLQLLRVTNTSSSSTRIEKPTATISALVHIVRIADLNHPAYGQHGLFAAQKLPPDSFIVQYLGYVHDEFDTDESSDYDICLDRELGISVDAANIGNEARFINDYRGVRPEGPNAEFRDCWVEVEERLWEKRIGIYVLTAGKSGKRAGGIGQGQEILVSYGKGFWSERQKK